MYRYITEVRCPFCAVDQGTQMIQDNDENLKSELNSLLDASMCEESIKLEDQGEETTKKGKELTDTVSEGGFSDTKSARGKRPHRKVHRNKKSEYVQPVPKLQQDAISTTSKKKEKKPKKEKLSSSEICEQDLCKALLIIKKNLSHRSLERSIIKLYQTVEKYKYMKENQETGNQSVISLPLPELVQSEMVSENLEQSRVVSHVTNENGGAPSQFSQQRQTIPQERQRFEKLVLPGRKQSRYHDVPADIAAFSNIFYQKNPATLAQLETLQKNLSTSLIVSKPRPELSINPQFKQQESALTKKTVQDVIFRFNEEDNKPKFLNEKEQEKHQLRRNLAKIFIERGFGFTKAIDDDLPPLEIGREHFRNLLGGIITASFRKLESFVIGQLGLTLKFLDRPQMKTMSHMLINCRVHLQPENTEIFLKFMRVVYGLGNVSITRNEAISVYVNVMKHLYGKGITIEQLQRKGRISNRRNLEAKASEIKRFIQTEKEKGARPTRIYRGTRYGSTASLEPTLKGEKSMVDKVEKSGWTLEMDKHLVGLQLQNLQLKKIQMYMNQLYTSLGYLSPVDFHKRIVELTQAGLQKIFEDSQNPLHSLSQILNIQNITQEQIEYISNAQETREIKQKILKYWQSPSLEQLELCLQGIKETLQNYEPKPVKDLYFEDDELNFEEEDFNDSSIFENGSIKFLDDIEPSENRTNTVQ